MTTFTVKTTFDLEERTLAFAKRVRAWFKKLKMNVQNIEDGKQLIRSSGSVGANYIEANEALGKKDFLMHLRISRKEAKESSYWLELMDVQENALDEERRALIQETIELRNIFSSMVAKSEIIIKSQIPKPKFQANEPSFER